MSKKGFWNGYWEGRDGPQPKNVVIKDQPISQINRFGKRVMNRIKKLESGQVGKEFKYHDVEVTGVVTNAATIDCITEIAQGNTSLTREGLQVKLQSIEGRMWIYNNTTTDNAQRLRIMIIRDSELDGVYPTITEILEASDVDAFKEKHQNRSRFKIYYDKVVILPSPPYSGQKVYRWKQYYKRFKKPITLNYTGSTAAQADQGRNAFFVVQVSDDATNGPANYSSWRLRFTE